jgi:sulfur-oxidizing protein SoxY
MNRQRRKVLKGTSGAAVMALAASAGLLRPDTAWAQGWNKAAFETKNLAETIKAMGGSASAESKDVVITSPDIAENGAVVPFTISSRLPKTEAMALLVEKNPNVLVGSYGIPAGTEANVTMRAKMGQTSNVIALVKADGKFYHSVKEVKVTIGGCGG